MKVIYKGPLECHKDKVFEIHWGPGPGPPDEVIAFWHNEERLGTVETKDLMAFKLMSRPKRQGDLVMISQAPAGAETRWYDIEAVYKDKLLKITNTQEGSELVEVKIPLGANVMIPKYMLTLPLELCPLFIPEVMSKAHPLSERAGTLNYIGCAWLFEITTSEPIYKVQIQRQRADLFWYAYQRHLTEVTFSPPGTPGTLAPGDLVAPTSSCSLRQYINQVIVVVSTDERPVVGIRARRNSNSEDDLFLRPTSIKKVIIKASEGPESPEEQVTQEKFFYEEITTPWWYAIRSNRLLARNRNPKQLHDGTYLVVVKSAEASELKKLLERMQIVEVFKNKTIQSIKFTKNPFVLALTLEGRWNKNITNFFEPSVLKKVWYGPLEETNERMNFYWKGKVVLRKEQLSKDFINQLLRRCPYEACK